MTLEEIRYRAAAMGLQSISRMRKHELVRTIQRAEGYTPCFGDEQHIDCVETDCCWRFDCLRKLDAYLSTSPT